jgi:hypothetical protein
MADHLSQIQLLQYCDGELPESRTKKAEEHLRTCESCALELRRLKQDLEIFANAQNQILDASLVPPPKPWPSLKSRFDAVGNTNHNLTGWKRVFRSFEIVWKTPLAYGSAALVLLLILLLMWGPLQPLSAKEVLQRATAADTARLKITPQQVVRQRVRITQQSKHVAGQTRLITSWKSIGSVYWDTEGDSLNADLHHRYEENGLGSDLPLSPLALQSWMKLAGSEPTTSRAGGSIEVQVASNGLGKAHGLEGFSFRVETRDWHVDEMKLSFVDASFQIVEENSSILDRREVPSDVLAELEQAAPKPADADEPHALTALHKTSPAINLDDLEVSVRYRLHQSGTDLGGSIEIAQRPPDQLVVKAWGLSSQAQDRVTSLLANQPGIQFEVQPSVPGRASPIKTITAVPQSTGQQSDDRLEKFFGGMDTEENYTRGVLRSDNVALEHLYALQELAVRWPPGQDSNLSATAKGQLEAIIRDHARATQVAVSELNSQIDFLLKGFGQETISEIPPGGGTNWQAVSGSTLEKARTVDHIVRSLLTTSDKPITLEEALPQIRQSVLELAGGAKQLTAAVP